MENVFATLNSWNSNGKAKGGDHPPCRGGPPPPREGPPPWISTLLGGHAETGRRVPKVGEEGGGPAGEEEGVRLGRRRVSCRGGGGSERGKKSRRRWVQEGEEEVSMGRRRGKSWVEVVGN